MSQPPPGPTQTRAARRAEQRRRRRRRQVRLTAAVLSVLALLAAAFAVALARDTPQDTGPAQAQTRTQRTLLLMVQGPNGAGIANALLAHDPRPNEGAVVLVPPQVLVNVAGSGSVPFGRSILTVQPANAAEALSDLMGVTVDDHWIVGQAVFQTLVDALGGVPVDVDVPVLRGQDVLVAPGPQNLDGARAYAFLTYLAQGEQEQVRLARAQEVLDGLVNVLPPTAGELAQLLSTLGDRSVSSLQPAGLAERLIGLATADEAGRLQYDVLPVVDLDPGGGVVAFRIDAALNEALVDRLLAASVPPGVRAGDNRVLVLNGVGTPGLGEAVRRKLVPADLVVVDTRNAPTFGFAQTQVIVGEATPEAQALGERVAAALGLPQAPVATQEIGTRADVVVVVGADFRPS